MLPLQGNVSFLNGVGESEVEEIGHLPVSQQTEAGAKMFTDPVYEGPAVIKTFVGHLAVVIIAELLGKDESPQ
jgi:hypothetical protein